MTIENIEKNLLVIVTRLLMLTLPLIVLIPGLLQIILKNKSDPGFGLKDNMEDTGERQIPKVPGTLKNIDIKHLERYRWASSYTHGKHVYDIACGTGYGSLLLEASSYTGFDNSLEVVTYASKYYVTDPSTTFKQVDACSMSPSLGVTDVIVSFETIEHIKNPEAFLTWCKSHGKLLLISSPIRGSFGRSRFHLFEYRLEEFNEILSKYFSKVTMFIQRKNAEIIYPCLTNDKGVAVAVCQP